MLDFNTLSEASEYAVKHFEASRQYYVQVRKQKPQEAYKDILNGKIAEWNAYYFLLDAGYKVTKPDHTIYETNEKSYDCDLYIEDKDIHLHVKAISIDCQKEYGASFMVEKKDEIVNTKPSNHFYMPMLEINFLEYRLHSWVNCSQVKYRKSASNKPTKLAVYLD